MTKEEFANKLADELWRSRISQCGNPYELAQEILDFLDNEVNVSLTIVDRPWTED